MPERRSKNTKKESFEQVVDSHDNGLPKNTRNSKTSIKQLDTFLSFLERRNPSENEFYEVVKDVMDSVWDLIEKNPAYKNLNIPERITEPERVLIFRVPWTDDEGRVHVNRGYRVEFNSAIGPYKGGLRFHPTVNLDTLKFLGFEQIFKNSLTTLNMGGAKGGSDFDPKGKSDSEVMRFCQSFMTELYRHIGPATDVPAGDIGVGNREIGYLFGQYKRLKNEFSGVLTGKQPAWGGSYLRPEATGYGLVYFVQEMLHTRGTSFKNKRVTISGSGNVAQFAAEKAIEFGAKVVTLSDSSGMIYDANGLNREKLNFIKKLKNEKRGRIKEYAEAFDGVEYHKGKKSWIVECQIALPCATQNEVDEKDVEKLVENGLICLAEGANKPCRPGAIHRLLNEMILYGPGKAANAGGVAVSGMEMGQNGSFTRWSREEVENRLKNIMQNIHEQCVEHGLEETSGYVNYKKGANRAGFIKVADAMIQQGIV
ncbi:MAG: NADP-specific glutamate dehydrogenase [Balneolaceae bacterium]|nr:NADP-specific glutamate dehydrogenase [Balneolaceae bacterium]